MEKLSFEAAMCAMCAAKIAFCWNSTDGSIEDFQKDMAALLCDQTEDQIMNMARRIKYAADTANNDKRINIHAGRTTGGLSKAI